jgi:hypothetical protein
MKYIITESQLESTIFRFLDSYLEKYSLEEISSLVVYGKGDKNQIAYDKGDQILMVREPLFQLVKRMFNLTTNGTRNVFIEFFKSKGYRVKRFV